MSSNDSSSLLRALQNPRIYDHAVDKFRLLETHISWVLLTGDYAYKIKKPVDFGFLDFSTLEKRRFFCNEELRLNSRLAPDIYLDVVAITGDDSNPRINGEGSAIEYAVKMRQFSQRGLMNAMLARGELNARQIDQLAEILADFHGRIDAAGPETRFGSPETVLAPVVENFRQIREFTGGEFESELAALEDWSLKEHHRRREVFERRKKDGFIRACHGDLHLGNIVIEKGKVIPFDGIEFNENLYWIDVISEIAFLIMDLEDQGRVDFAYRALNAYLQQTGDYSGLAVLHYYLVYRAMVRAKVNGIRLSQPESVEERAESRARLVEYLGLAQSYTRAIRPKLIIFHGLSGSGKTTVSQKLLEAMPAIRIRSDVERKRLFGLKEREDSRSAVSGGIYTADASRSTYGRLFELARTVIDAGFTVLVDAAFLKEAQRRPFKALAGELNVPYLIVDCYADEATLHRRVDAREKAGADASEAGLAVLEHQLAHSDPLTGDELADCVKIFTEKGVDVSMFLERIEKGV
ncbi:MAG: bifunctional aminoglycoside phosphotransferase/ATP-binding protein [Gammaproteobacteria bacterium]